VRNIFSKSALSNVLETMRHFKAKKNASSSPLLEVLCYKVAVNDLHGVGALRASVSHNEPYK
jgi:hypothetical protein